MKILTPYNTLEEEKIHFKGCSSCGEYLKVEPSLWSHLCAYTKERSIIFNDCMWFQEGAKEKLAIQDLSKVPEYREALSVEYPKLKGVVADHIVFTGTANCPALNKGKGTLMMTPGVDETMAIIGDTTSVYVCEADTDASCSLCSIPGETCYNSAFWCGSNRHFKRVTTVMEEI